MSSSRVVFFFGAQPTLYAIMIPLPKGKSNLPGGDHGGFLLERAEYAFQNARGDLHGNVRLSDTFIYGRHAALARPLTDVLWVYWQEKSGAVDVHLLTADGRDCMLRLSGQTARRNAEEILQAVAARNSGVLVGRTRENGLRYDRQVPRIRQQRVRRIVLWAVWLTAAAAAFAVLALT